MRAGWQKFAPCFALHVLYSWTRTDARSFAELFLSFSLDFIPSSSMTHNAHVTAPLSYLIMRFHALDGFLSSCCCGVLLHRPTKTINYKHLAILLLSHTFCFAVHLFYCNYYYYYYDSQPESRRLGALGRSWIWMAIS